MDLSARRALHLEGVKEVALLGVLWPQVGDSGTARQCGCLEMRAWLTEESTHPASSAVRVSAYIFTIGCCCLLGLAVDGKYYDSLDDLC